MYSEYMTGAARHLYLNMVAGCSVSCVIGISNPDYNPKNSICQVPARKYFVLRLTCW